MAHPDTLPPDVLDALATKVGTPLAEFGAVRVHGKRSFLDRDTAIKNFKLDKACKVLVATPAAAKEGLTLTVANHAVFYDRSYALSRNGLLGALESGVGFIRYAGMAWAPGTGSGQ